VRNSRVWAGLLGVERSTVIDGAEFDDEAQIVVVAVRPRKGAKGRCGICQKRCGGYDRSEGSRRWCSCYASPGARSDRSWPALLLRVSPRVIRWLV